MTVMRDGATVGSDEIKNVSEAQIIKMMVGREVSELFPKQPPKLGDVVLKVENLASSGQFTGINFEVRKGEIFGLAGLVGSGRSEIVRAIFGVDHYDSGSVSLNGVQLEKGSASKAMAAGIALVPEDRRQQGLLMPYSIAKNTSITVLQKLIKNLVVKKKDEEQVGLKWAKTLQLKFASMDDAVERLSGGNQQKVVLGKWLATEPAVLIVDEPTRGIDVGTKSEVHRLLSLRAQEGLAIIMVSSELPEVLGMSDRILVMREGRQVAILNRDEATPEKVIALATGAAA
jgi:rhamnose transport system ATP-binding protein